MRWAVVVLLLASSAAAAPVVPSFRTGTMTSRTESTTQITEQIRSVNYSTGYTYSASGTNVQHSGTGILPGASETQTQTIDGVTSSWTGLELQDKPDWSIVKPGEPFSFVEHYEGPGLEAVTDVTRTIVTETVTDTVSVFGP